MPYKCPSCKHIFEKPEIPKNKLTMNVKCPKCKQHLFFIYGKKKSKKVK